MTIDFPISRLFWGCSGVVSPSSFPESHRRNPTMETSCTTTTTTRGKNITTRKLSIVAWFFLIYLSMKSLTVMYDCVVYDTLSARETLLARTDGVEKLEEIPLELEEAVGLVHMTTNCLHRIYACIASSERLCWLMLFASIFTETWATTVSKYASDQSSPALLAFACFLVILSQCGLTVSLAQIDVGVAYAMWAAIGTAAVSMSAMVLFAEDFDLVKVGCLIMIIVGVAGLNLREQH